MKAIKIKAINPKNQAIVNECIKAMVRYENYLSLRIKAQNNNDNKMTAVYNEICLNAMEDYLLYQLQLPENQCKVLDKVFYNL